MQNSDLENNQVEALFESLKMLNIHSIKDIQTLYKNHKQFNVLEVCFF